MRAQEPPFCGRTIALTDDPKRHVGREDPRRRHRLRRGDIDDSNDSFAILDGHDGSLLVLGSELPILIRR